MCGSTPTFRFLHFRPATGIGTQSLGSETTLVAIQNGSGVKWKGVSELVPGFQQTVVVFSPQFAAQREHATRWMIAYIRGIREYNDAFVKNIRRPQTVEALSGAHPPHRRAGAPL